MTAPITNAMRKTLTNDEKELVRALQIAGRAVFDQKFEHQVNLKWQVVYTIGKRFWLANYAGPEWYDQALVWLAKEALSDIIIALRADIEKMYAELEEPCQVLTSPSDLDAGVDNTLVSIKIMQRLDGAAYFCRKSASKSDRVHAFFALGETCIAPTDRASESDAAQQIIAAMGMRAILLMLKEYDELVKRCSSAERVADKLWAVPELVSRRAFAVEGDEAAEKPEEPENQLVKKRKTKK